jgi:hypothetical protein
MVGFMPQRYKHLWESIPVFIEEEDRWVQEKTSTLSNREILLYCRESNHSTSDFQPIA